MAESSVHHLPDFTGKAVIVTGASRGIGAGIALRFAQAGADVVVNYLSSESAAQAVAGGIRALGRQALPLQGDVRQRADVERMVAEALARLGQLDVLINNAGIDPLAPILEMTDAQWDEVVDTDLRGVFLCTQIAASAMIRQAAGGAIVNIASIEAENAAASHSHYNAAKAGVVMHTRNAARELGRYGVRVNCVSPGLIDPGNLAAEWPDGVARYTAAAPLGRVGTPEDVADACLFLASPAARWITGANLIVDGGVLTNTVY
jgi:NAD(P)-dependent dehydrogenase (short-subunit alcohol dehydrogenase family)